MKWNKWLVGGAVLGALYLLIKGREAVDQVAKGLTVTSSENFIYSGVNAVGDIIDDGQDNGGFSLGSWIYDVFHPNEGKELGLAGSGDDATFGNQLNEGIGE